MAIQKDEETLQGQTIIYDDENGGVAIDYSSYFERIAASLENISGEGSNVGLEKVANQLELLSTLLQQISGDDSTLGLERIVNVLEASLTSFTSSAGSLKTIADKQTTIASSQTTIADKQTLIESYHKIIKDLAEGPGIRTLSPYETFSAVAIYKLFVEEGKILEFLDGEASTEQKEAALNKISNYFDQIKNNIPKDF